MNDENLIPFTERSPREHQELSRRGAEATNKIKKQKKMMREVVQTLMSTNMSEDLVEKLRDKLPFLEPGMDFQTAIVMGQLVSGMGGNSKAFELLSEFNDTEKTASINEYQEELSVSELRGLLDESEPTKSTDNPKT